MAKDFKSKSPLNNFTSATSEPEIKNTVQAKKRVGRPVQIAEPRKNINIAVKVELLDKYNEVKKALGGNLTAYIGNLIEKDMAANYESYKTIASIQDKIGL